MINIIMDENKRQEVRKSLQKLKPQIQNETNKKEVEEIWKG